MATDDEMKSNDPSNIQPPSPEDPPAEGTLKPAKKKRLHNDEEENEEEEEEEEEEEDDDQAAREMQGFIVDDSGARNDDDGEGRDEEEEEDDDDDAALDEDDLDLIAENMGISVPERSRPAPAQQKYRRLKRPGREDDGEESERELFREDEAPPEEDWKEEEMMGEEIGEEEGQRGNFAMHPEIENLIVEVFGDARAVMEILGRRRPREVGEAGDEQVIKSAAKQQSDYLDVLEDDEETLTRIDQPERLFLRYRKRPVETSAEEIALESKWLTSKLVAELGPNLSLSPSDLLEKYNEILGPRCEHYDPTTTTVEMDFEDKIAVLLNMLLNQRLEVPFILTHRAHLIAPPLNPKLVWMVYEMDQEWCRLRHHSLHLKKLLSTLPEPRLPIIEQFPHQLDHFQTEEQLEDIRLFLIYNNPDLTEEEPALPSGASPSTRRRRQAAPGLDALRLIKKFDLDSHWKPHLLTSDQLAANLNKSDAFSALLSNPDLCDVPVDLVIEHSQPEEPPLPGRDANAVKSWLNSLAVGPFSSGTRVLESLLSHEAKVLASHPSIRSSLRKWFRRAAKITTVTTQSGELSVVPGMSNWAALRLLRKPIDEFFNHPLPPVAPPPSGDHPYELLRAQISQYTKSTRIRETFAEILKAEMGHLVQVVVHPTMPSDSVPWRGECEDVFVNRIPKKLQKLSQMEAEALAGSDKMDQAQVDKLLSVLKGLYLNAGSTGWGVTVQEKILIRLLEKELFPVFRKEIRQLLARRAHAHIMSRCQADLEWRLGLRPYRRPNGRPFYDRDDDSDGSASEESSDDSDDSDSDNDDDDDRMPHTSPRVVGVTIERLVNGCRVHAMAIDRSGTPTQYRKFDRLLEMFASRRPLPEASRPLAQKRADAEKKALKKFLLLSDVAPDLVLIGASDIIVRHLADIVTSVRDKLKKRHRFEVMFGSLEVPRIFAASELCPKEFRDNYGPCGCQGIGLGRLGQDPLASHLQLWSIGSNDQNLLLDLKLHPLQDIVPRDKLQSSLLQVIQMAVASVGVDLQFMKGHPHLQSPLQFVSGLGPNKAADILHRLSSRSPILVRAELLSLVDASISDDEDGTNGRSKRGLCDGPVGPGVYRNCASFIRIPHDSSHEGGESSDPLAASRIDPVDCYIAAQKMCRDALEDIKTTSPNDCVWAVMKRPDCLEELDLEAYSVILNSKSQPRMLPLLEFIRRELEHPYKDPRIPFESISGERAFYLLVQEDPFQFCPGCETTACIIESRSGLVRLAIPPSDIPATPLDISEYLRIESAKHQYASSETILPRGGMVACRLQAIQFADFSTTVVLTQQGALDVLLDTLDKELPGLINRQTASTIISAILAAQAPTSQPNVQTAVDVTSHSGGPEVKKILLKRQIQHPRFRQATHQRAVAELRPSSIRVGEALFKPSESSNAEVVLYIKVCAQPFLFKGVTIQESKQRTHAHDCRAVVIGELGQELRIGNEKFHDLDQILGQYVEALRVNLQEIYSFDKYREDVTVQAVEASLAADQEQKASINGAASIEWGIVVDSLYESNRVGVRFHLITIPPRQPHCAPVILRDSIYVTHEGFKLWNHKEKSLRKLVNWWKTKGYFQRPVLLSEYAIAKKKQFEKKRQQQHHVQQQQQQPQAQWQTHSQYR